MVNKDGVGGSEWHNYALLSWPAETELDFGVAARFGMPGREALNMLGKHTTWRVPVMPTWRLAQSKHKYILVRDGRRGNHDESEVNGWAMELF